MEGERKKCRAEHIKLKKYAKLKTVTKMYGKNVHIYASLRAFYIHNEYSATIYSTYMYTHTHCRFCSIEMLTSKVV